MKKILIIVAIAAGLAACKTSQVGTGTDDIYANPREERMLARQAEEERTRKDAEVRKQQEAEQNAREAREDANPKYKDPLYNSEDYYDYEYASRLNRFHNPIYGAGYYDPYYTNMYTYNQNPGFYGTSIYSSVLAPIPSTQFGFYSVGISTGLNYGSCFYDPYGSYACNYPLYSNYPYSYYGYQPWGYSAGFYNGYNAGFYNGYNAGWGYLNMYDPNSGYGHMSYAPRGSNGGGNSPSRTNAGMERPSGDGYFERVVQEQHKAPRFSNTDERANSQRVTNRSARPAVNETEGTGSTRVRKNRGDQSPAVERGRQSNQQNHAPAENRVKGNQSQPQESQHERSGNPSNEGGNNRGSSPRSGGGNPRR